MKRVLEVVAGVVWQNELYLAVERPEGRRMAGWWEFPGGKVEQGESKSEALVREFQEELGITPLEYDFWTELEHEYDEFVVHLSFFNIYNYSGELTPLENQRMAWVDPTLPPRLEFLPADVKIVEALHS